MNLKQNAKLFKLGIFTQVQADDIGLPQYAMSRLVAQGKLLRLSRGIFAHPDTKLIDDKIAYRIACARFGEESAVAGLSALFEYGLTDQPPGHIWMIVPTSIQSSLSEYRLMRTSRNFNVGIKNETSYRIVSIERAAIEGLKFMSKIGERTALKAVRKALSNRQTTETKLSRMAEALNLTTTLRKHFEAIV